jgi:hypothetical protein
MIDNAVPVPNLFSHQLAKLSVCQWAMDTKGYDNRYVGPFYSGIREPI